MEEKWLPVPGYEGLYEVSDKGRLRWKSGRLKVPTVTDYDPRPFTQLSKHNRAKTVRIHTLVLTAFVGPRPDRMEACHWDGDPANNHLENLRWDTRKNNHADKIRHGTTARGERTPWAQLTWAQADAIRADSRINRLVAADYGVSESVVQNIKSGKTWRHF